MSLQKIHRSCTLLLTGFLSRSCLHRAYKQTSPYLRCMNYRARPHTLSYDILIDYVTPKPPNRAVGSTQPQSALTVSLPCISFVDMQLTKYIRLCALETTHLLLVVNKGPSNVDYSCRFVLIGQLLSLLQSLVKALGIDLQYTDLTPLGKTKRGAN